MTFQYENVIVNVFSASKNHRVNDLKMVSKNVFVDEKIISYEFLYTKSLTFMSIFSRKFHLWRLDDIVYNNS